MRRRDLLKAAGIGAAATALPLRSARAAPPYDFSTFVSTSRIKLFGGNLINPPNWATPSGIDTSWPLMYQNFTTGTNIWTNWWQPQIAKWQSQGGKHVRLIGPMQGVLAGTYTQAYANACISTVLADVKSRGMTASFCGMAVTSLSSIGSPSAATVWATFKDLLDNVIVPNYLDVVAYVEPGNQESRNNTGSGGSNDLVTNNAIAGLMKAGGYATPVGISATAGNTGSNSYPDFSPYTPANYDIALIHMYPEQVPLPLRWGSPRDFIYTVSATVNKPYLIEETAWGVNTPFVDQNFADYLELVLYAAFGDPNCLGLTYWGGYGDPSEVNDFRLWASQSPYNPNGMNPALIWANTVAGDVFAAWKANNRNQVFPQTLHASQATTGSRVQITLDGVTPIQGHAITSGDGNNDGQLLGLKVWHNTPISYNFTFSLTGNDNSIYRISFGVNDFLLSAYTEIGHYDVRGSITNKVVSFSGTMPPGDMTPGVFLQRVAGSVEGTLTAMSGTITYGNAFIPRTVGRLAVHG